MLDTDLLAEIPAVFAVLDAHGGPLILTGTTPAALGDRTSAVLEVAQSATLAVAAMWRGVLVEAGLPADGATRSEEHTSELPSLMRISSAVVCLKKKTRIPCTSSL